MRKVKIMKGFQNSKIDKDATYIEDVVRKVIGIQQEVCEKMCASKLYDYKFTPLL